MMEKTIRAKFSEGVFKPLEKVDIEEGTEVSLTISEIPEKKRVLEVLRKTAGGWKDLIDAENLKENIYSARLIRTRPEPEIL